MAGLPIRKPLNRDPKAASASYMKARRALRRAACAAKCAEAAATGNDPAAKPGKRITPQDALEALQASGKRLGLKYGKGPKTRRGEAQEALAAKITLISTLLP